MLAVVIERAGEPTRRKVYGYGVAVTIGRAPGNDIVLDGDEVDAHHARFVLERELLTVEVMGTLAVRVGTKRVRGERAFRAVRDLVHIGPYVLRVVGPPVLPVAGARDPVEDELLAAIAERDDASRLVYADWLEHRGDATRAEFLRVQHALGSLAADDPRFEPAADRLRELATQVDLDWRIAVARPAIENCEVALDFACPKEWGSLAPTDRAGVRYCGACKSNVFYATTIGQAREHAARGECIALDIAAPRWASDLAPPYGMHRCPFCKLDTSSAPRSCPGCGTELQSMIRGRMVVPRG